MDLNGCLLNVPLNLRVSNTILPVRVSEKSMLQATPIDRPNPLSPLASKNLISAERDTLDIISPIVSMIHNARTAINL